MDLKQVALEIMASLRGVWQSMPYRMPVIP